MANLDLSQLTLAKEHAQDMSQVILETAFSNPEITEIHDIHLDANPGKRIPIFGNFGLIGQEITSCSFADNGEEIPVSEKTWDFKTTGFRLEHCAKTTPQLFKAFNMGKGGLAQFDMFDSDLMNFLGARGTEALKLMVTRLAWFGDTTADNVSGSGVITNGIDVNYFTPIDGLWKQAFAGVAGSTIKRYTIAKNSEASEALQMALDSDTAYDVLSNMYALASPEMRKDKKTLTFKVTDSLYTNWEAYAEDKSTAFTLKVLEDGTTDARFRGIKVIPMPEWDRIIKSYMDNGTTLDMPHRAVLCASSNIPIGTPSEDSMDTLESFYDQKDKKNYLDAAIDMDAKILKDSEIVVAY